ncbi:MAG TPA: HD domain-containing phosphohydrolase [Candidatus Manganitrophaceae bacterium]|nr:HD domain-containing phosphohydrolase [Candidatus Manganitrophaceae bacterium]
MLKRARILIVDDQLGPRKSLEMILSPFYEIFGVESGDKALRLLQEQKIDVVTLDLRMPGMDGIEVLRHIKRVHGDIEVIIITGFGELSTAREAINLGAACYLLKPFNFGDVLSAVNRAVEKKKQVDRLKNFLTEVGAIVGFDVEIGKGIRHLNDDPSLLEKVKEALNQTDQEAEAARQMNYFEFFRVLIETIESKDPYAQGHSSRVHYYANLIAQRLQLSQQEKEELQIGSYLHDIGKLGVEPKIIRKKEKYTPEELELIRKHTEIGATLVAPLSLSQNVLEVIRHHHEHYAGDGYPDGIRGQELSIVTRIVSVADAFDAMVSDYPYEYRKVFSLEEAVAELKRCALVQFDPDVVNALLQTIEEEKEKLILKSSLISNL